MAAPNVGDACGFCNGKLRKLGRALACATCGREPGALVAAAVASPVPSSQLPAGKPCSVNGCPGIVRGSAPCECCQRRAAFLEQHMPKRECAICGGAIRGRGMIKYCKPCKPVAAKVQIANAPCNADPKKKKGAVAR